MNHRDYIPTFSKTKEFIQRKYGFKLSLIEQVHLKRIVNECLIAKDDIIKYDSAYVSFGIKTEVMSRFFNECYGIHPQVSLAGHFLHTNPATVEYVRRLHDRAHLI